MADLIAMRGKNRERNVAVLERAGFRPAPWIPLREHGATLRPTVQIAERMMALGALVAWAEDERTNPTRALRAHIERSSLDQALTDREREVLTLERAEAREAYAQAMTWHRDELWSLAWILGYEPEPSFDGRPMLDDDVRTLTPFAQRGLDATAEGFAARAKLRPTAEVVLLEDLFVCAHNAALRAAMGEPTARPAFDPIRGGAAILARRHGLSWALSPGVDWDKTDLSA